jgi:hypothetical protein
MRLQSLVDELAGSLKDDEMPGWETAESAAAWVHKNRQADQAREDERLRARK